MTDYIRKAVELAEGFRWLHRDQVEIPDLNNAVLLPLEQQWVLDALAAQLVRQVDELAIKHQSIKVIEYASIIAAHQFAFREAIEQGQSFDRTMNTIKAIVDSGVLDAKLQEQNLE